ncbi:MAG: hypothetical protein RMJ66_05530, partial [Bacteroidia bacterium]|nr:hypothetical protein [Bacteroidia bacterium]MDW8134510.1 hypothetical protein [Bacteroidia bacterium]
MQGIGIYLGCLFFSPLLAQKSQCILVKLKRAADLTSDNALHPSWEEKRIVLKLPNSEWEESFLEVDEERDRPIAECFLPQFKLITERYTYVISLACENLIAFQNSAAYQPSSQRIQSALVFSEDLRYFIEKAAEKYMKIPPKRLYAEYSLAYVPPVQNAISYEELEFLLSHSQLIEEEDEEPEEPEESS